MGEWGKASLPPYHSPALILTMYTIGRNYHGPLHNYTDMCDYCGGMWHRDKLVLDPEGKLRCPDDMDGLTELELAEISAQNVGEIQPVEGKKREGV